MTVYRITHKKFADKLVASGIENWWNFNGQFVIYCSANKALACLENLVHTNAETLGNDLYMCIEIFIPDTSSITVISLKDLPQNFTSEDQKTTTREIGNKWYTGNKNLLLEVPSAIIPSEKNFLVNTMHEDFKKVKISGKEPFNFDRRLKDNFK
jgi:RES domain-containing protein